MAVGGQLVVARKNSPCIAASDCAAGEAWEPCSWPRKCGQHVIGTSWRSLKSTSIQRSRMPDLKVISCYLTLRWLQSVTEGQLIRLIFVKLPGYRLESFRARLPRARVSNKNVTRRFVLLPIAHGNQQGLRHAKPHTQVAAQCQEAVWL